MLFRLARSVKRSDSSARQFVQRIPADVRHLAVGRTLVVALGPLTVRTTITPAMESVRFERAAAGGEPKGPPREGHPDAVRLMDEAFGRAVAASGTNVLPFVRREPAES